MGGVDTLPLVFFVNGKHYCADGADRPGTASFLRWYGLNGSFADSEWQWD